MWKTQREGVGEHKSQFFSRLFLRLRVHFIAVAKSAYDLGLQQLFTPIDISINQSGSSAQAEGRARRKVLAVGAFSVAVSQYERQTGCYRGGHLVKVCRAAAVITSKPTHDSLQPTRRLKNSILNYTGDILVTVGTV